MSYLSRVALQPQIGEQTQLAHLLMDHQYSMHRLLWDLFPGRDGQQRDFLFREEQQTDGRGRKFPLFYLVSAQAPQSRSPLFRIDTRPYQPKLRQGDRLAFTLRANPVVSRKNGNRRSSRHDVAMDAQHQCLQQLCDLAGLSAVGTKRERIQRLEALPPAQLQALICGLNGSERISLPALLKQTQRQALQHWLAKQGDTHGFALDSDSPLQQSACQWSAIPEKDRRAGFTRVDFEGVLTVTEPEAFIAMLQKGLGKSRAFGCGLMMVRRL